MQGFVDNDGRHIPIHIALQKRMCRLLGRQVQKLGLPEANVVKHGPVVAHPRFGPNAPLPQLCALVFHQCHEWGHDQAKSASTQGWQLKTEAFAAASGQQGHDMVALRQVEHRPDLMGTQA